MFIYNFKINEKSIVKIVFTVITVAITIYFVVSAFKIYNNSFRIKDETSESDVINLTVQNYTNVLKAVHENPKSYIGKKISFTGYVHRLIDFKDTQFVLARDMVISSDMQTLVVGFLCDSKKAKKFKDNAWVEITGEITSGEYHGKMPVLKIKDIKEIDKPSGDIYVYPPDDTYVPTLNTF